MLRGVLIVIIPFYGGFSAMTTRALRSSLLAMATAMPQIKMK